jgi:ribonucleoside-diphosphate reductase alpha chain
MIRYIVKRTGQTVKFEPEKITEAILKAMHSIQKGNLPEAEALTHTVVNQLETLNKIPKVEEVQDIVVNVLMNADMEDNHLADVSEAYILYRDNRKRIREEKLRIEKSVNNNAYDPKRSKGMNNPSTVLDLKLKPTSVVNRFGQKESIDVTKIRQVINEASKDLDQIDPLTLEVDSQIHFYDGISTRSIQQTLIRVANEKTSSKNPNWTFVASRLLIHELYKESMRNRNITDSPYSDFYGLIKKLTEIGRYDKKILDSYKEKQIKELENYIKQDRDKLFTFPGLKHLSDRYVIKGLDDETMELPQHVFMGISMYLALAEKSSERVQWSKKFYDVLSNLYITMATPTFANARRTNGQLSSCFIDTPEDSLEGIFNGLKTFSKVSQNGGGMGVYLGKLRSLGSSIRGYKGAGSGVIPWVRLYNDTAVSVNQLGQRAGAVSLWLDIWHKDILDFLDLKTNSGDERRKAHDVFPSVCIPDLFYKKLQSNENWYLFDPGEVRKKMGYSLEDFWGEEWEKRYNACENNTEISRTEVPALEIMASILKSLFETGGPFIINRDTVNRMNPNKHVGMIYSSNLCTEICQNQSPTVRISTSFSENMVREEYKSGDLVVCNLSSLNLGRANTKELIRSVVPVQVRMLDDVITMNTLPLEEAAITNQRYRAIGLGISGYHQHLAQKGIDWESEDHLKYVDDLFEEINYVAIKSSEELAEERGAYPLCKGSDWETGEYFKLRNYNSERWGELSRKINKNGIRNGYIMAIAPTGSTSVIAGSTAGIDPVFQTVFVEEKKGFIIKQVAPDLNPTTLPFYKSAHSMDQMWSVRAAAIRQKHIDQSQSMNIYATPEMDEQAFLNLYFEAWRLGVKTIYYFRNYTENENNEDESCEACQA